MIDRRRFLLTSLYGALAVPLAAEAQRERTPTRIGVLHTNTPASTTGGLHPSFWERLSELGWVDGRNITVELRGTAGEATQLPILAADLMSLKPNVIVMDNGSSAKRVAEITRPTPVCVVGGDLQAAGAVKNLAKPEGHITGVQLFQPDLVGKRVSLLKEAVSGLAKVGLLIGQRDAPMNVAVLRVAADSCRTAGLELHVREVLIAQDLEPAFAALTRAGVNGVLIMNNPSLTVRRDQVVALMATSRLPAIYEYSPWPGAGGLMSYGAVVAEYNRLLAECVDKILRGGKPLDIPVQQPTKFELVINLKTARALGLTLPPSLLVRADQVIE